MKLSSIVQIFLPFSGITTVATPPTVPGVEWTLDENFAHWTLDTNRAHWTLDPE